MILPNAYTIHTNHNKFWNEIGFKSKLPHRISFICIPIMLMRHKFCTLFGFKPIEGLHPLEMTICIGLSPPPFLHMKIESQWKGIPLFLFTLPCFGPRSVIMIRHGSMNPIHKVMTRKIVVLEKTIQTCARMFS